MARSRPARAVDVACIMSARTTSVRTDSPGMGCEQPPGRDEHHENRDAIPARIRADPAAEAASSYATRRRAAAARRPFASTRPPRAHRSRATRPGGHRARPPRSGHGGRDPNERVCRHRQSAIANTPVVVATINPAASRHRAKQALPDPARHRTSPEPEETRDHRRPCDTPVAMRPARSARREAAVC